VLFRQFVDDDLGCASYLIGDEAAGLAVVVDPAYRIEPYLEEAERREVRIVRTLETHTHADHVSGHGRLALEHGIPVSIHPLGEPEYAFEPLEDGQKIELGDVAITVLHTPGHRPEHCCFAVADRSRADEAWLVLTGDSLFVGDAARPDLAVEAREGAADLFRSLRRLAELGDGVELYPGHVAGSMCGAGMSSKASSTIGFERRFNPMLRIETVEDFVGESTGTSGARPPNVEHVVALNRGPFVGASEPLGTAAGDGAVVLDVRPARAFAAGHVAGALSVPLDSSAFGTKAGFVVAPGEDVVLHAESEADAELAAQRLRAVGLLRVRGRLESPEISERLEPIELDELKQLVADDAVEVVDVREADERDAGYIPGSRHVPYRLVRTFAGKLGNGKPVVTICESGSRAVIAASVLSAAGVDARPVLDAGVGDWEARGGQTVSFRRCGSG
jgi:glyoxylase-like metal-dependent hydrolase (beta-lactamase superfamily II)/rhodanese-related sulfurtransferase